MSSNFSRRRTNGGVAALRERVRTPGTVDVGIIDAGKHDSGDKTVAEIGFFNEFGTERIHERSFMRSTIRSKKREIIKLQKKLLKKISKGDIRVGEALGVLGEVMADEIRKKIVSLKLPENSPITVIRKGSSNPLIDTGQLKNSITYEVNR